MNDVESTASAEPTEAVQTETAVERPEWLPEKFKSAEDLANAYSSLEGKLGQQVLVIMNYQKVLMKSWLRTMNYFHGGLITHLKMASIKKNLAKVSICTLVR